MVTSIGSITPSPAGIGFDDLGGAIASLGVQSGEVERDTAAAARRADEALAEAQSHAQVDALRSEAGSMRDGALFDGAMAFLQATAGGKSSGVGAVLCGVKGTGDGLYGAAEKDDEASAKGFEAAASAAQNAAEGAHDAISSADQLVQSSLDLYKEYVATEGQTANAAAGRV
ncbi:MAG: hypothetical protein ACRENE_23390 [Polyangiaceae bacterium]